VDPQLPPKLAIEQYSPSLFAILPVAFVIFAALLFVRLIRTSLRAGLTPITVVRHLFRLIGGLIRHVPEERLGVFVLSHDCFP
jgi:hypothetical protein